MMKLSCIDCEKFASCAKCTRAWRKSWREYPGKDQASIEKRLNLMSVQYSICYGQETFSTYVRKERGLQL